MYFIVSFEFLSHLTWNLLWSQYMEDDEFLDLLQILSDLSTSETWFIRHGSFLALSSMSLHNPSMMCRSLLFPSLLDYLKDALKDDKVLNLWNDVMHCKTVSNFVFFSVETVSSSWNCYEGNGKVALLSGPKGWKHYFTTCAITCLSFARWVQWG